MFKIFRNIGIITLVFLSFIYTEKIVSVVKDYDEIMVEIKHTKNEYKIEPIEAILTDTTIIPGISGKEVNVDKSYAKMKQYGKFESTLLAYDKINPKNRLKDNLDKLIIKGNSSKNMISLVFLLKNVDEIEDIVALLNERNMKGNFFIDSSWIGTNETTIIDLVKQGHMIGNLSYRGDYKNTKFMELDNIIKKLAGQKVSYCYLEEYDKEALSICSKQGDYTIKPNIIIKNTLADLKKNLESGSIISIENLSGDLTLDMIVNYIQGKGYEVVDLKTLLSE